MDDLDIHLINNKKQKKQGSHTHIENEQEIKENFIQELNKVLKSFEPVSVGLRDFILKGD